LESQKQRKRGGDHDATVSQTPFSPNKKLLLTCHSCGPFKVAYILDQCLNRLDHPEENLQHESSGSDLPHISWADRADLSTGQTLNERQSSRTVVAQPKDDVTTSHVASSTADDPDAPNLAQQSLGAPQVLIVDDNGINRKVGHAYRPERTTYSHKAAPCGLYETSHLLVPRSRKWLGRSRSIQKQHTEVSNHPHGHVDANQ
jgi:hypothetical protein